MVGCNLEKRLRKVARSTGETGELTRKPLDGTKLHLAAFQESPRHFELDGLAVLFGTNDFLTGLIEMCEKTAWMLRAFLDDASRFITASALRGKGGLAPDKRRRPP